MYITITTAVVVLIAIACIYNLLVRKRNEVTFAFACIDTRSKQRHDLIPNLIGVCNRYMGFEEQVLKDLTKTRTDARNPAAGVRAAAAARLSGLIHSVYALAEGYPQLRSVDTFTVLQRSLNEVEEQLAAARRAYNAAILGYNTCCQAFPINLLARPLGFTHLSGFEATAAERTGVDVGGRK